MVPANKLFHGRKLNKARFKEPFWKEILTAQYPEDAKVSEVKEFIHGLISCVRFATNGPFCFDMNHVLMKARLPCALITSKGYCISSLDDVGRYRFGLNDINDMDQLDSHVASLVAQAIAAAEHNFTRSLLTGDWQYWLDDKSVTIYTCILFMRTALIFFRIPVSKELTSSVATGIQPRSETHISLCIPTMIEKVENPTTSLANRDIIFRYY
ncbi:hypothetical protein M422DRAFT_67234 [Sphaerobolus stellatus SS14]|uniref:Unplaced genomic scaffold SPHSTscaffold_38, whole genome shotgun sequence n=1 Tax=Sphaerobolus stellatus (strain SS14) TaxID=990650 RepID=A0A0C9VRM6_SPHS4|nr:hypothetical protein M422DRAFT_67234 [Sphaerobolus stellatus SS14]